MKSVGTSSSMLESLLSIVIVSSPCSSHPDTVLIEKAISSFSKVTGLDKCAIVIVLDGFIIRETPRPKKGQITEEMRVQYDAYHQRLSMLYGDDGRVSIR
jgi:predicted AlkP superfamily pyrophosphatase or phosphodiesterase